MIDDQNFDSNLIFSISFNELFGASKTATAISRLSDGVFVEVNQAFLKLHEYLRDEVIGHSSDELNLWNFPLEREKIIELLTLQGHSISFPHEYKSKLGKVGRALASVNIVDINGSPYLIGFLTDSIELDEIQLALLNSERSYQSLFNNMLEGFAYCRMLLENDIPTDFVYLSVNKSFEDLTGLKNVVGKKVSDVIPGLKQTNPELLQIYGQVAKTGLPSRFETYIPQLKIILLVSVYSPEKGYFVATFENITDRKAKEKAQSESEQRYRSLFNNAEVAMFRSRLDGSETLDCNTKFLEVVGRTREEVIGKPSAILWENPQRRAEMVRQLISDGQVTDFEYGMLTPNGELRHCVTSLRLYPDSGLLEGSIRDITIQKQAENALLKSESRLRVMLENDLIGIVTSKDRIIQWANPAYEKLLGYEKGELNGVSSRIIFPSDEAYLNLAKNAYPVINAGKVYRTELIYQRKDGSHITVDLSGGYLPDTGEVLWAGVDISQRKKVETELSLIAHYDSLTKVPNRVLLADRMKQAIAQTSREQNVMAVCYLDLDGFKPINDSLGHDAGDNLLIEVANRIVNTIRGGDTVARLGGDEFVVLLLGLEKAEECVVTLERLLAVIAEPIAVKNKATSVSASIGVSIYPIDDEDPDTLLRHADQAMYVAKQSGKNRFHIYDVELDKRTKNQSEFVKSIQHALEQNQFELHYQPLVNMRTRKLIGAEALIRWRHPERGLLSPAEFLRQVENTYLDIKIGEWVIATALAQLNHWQSIGMNIEVGINISGYHIESSGFVDNLQTQIANYSNFPRGKLIIEVLETVALNDISTVQGVIESCGTMGVGFALDDFGTGYSSLAYLSGLSVDVLKIDQSFVRDMLTNKKDMAIVQGIIALANAFEMHTVAEGIETDEHYQALLNLECEFGQGYGIARPMPANDLIVWQSDYR